MKPMFHFVFVVSLLASLLFLTTTHASACSCAGNLPFSHHVINADAIFSGKVIGQEQESTPTSYGEYHLFSTIAVEKLWKGASQPIMTVAVNLINSCAFGLEVGKEYLLFAETFEGALSVSLCSPSQSLSTAEETIALLDQFFAGRSSLPLHSAATVTVPGTGIATIQADRMTVRFSWGESSAGKSEAAMWTELEQQQPLFLKLLQAEKVLAPLQSSLTMDSNGFYLSTQLTSFSRDELFALLDQLTRFETTLAKDERLSIRQIEVMFSLANCTETLMTAQHSALLNARNRARLLAAVLGGAVDTVKAISEDSNDTLSPDGGDLCQTLRWRQWHELPLMTDLPTLLTIDAQANLHVTFGITKRVTAQQMPTTVFPFVSPLPTPTS